MLLSMLRFILGRRKPLTFVFGNKEVAVLTGTVGGHHAVILMPRTDKHLKELEADHSLTGDSTRFKNAVILQFPTEGQAAVVAHGLTTSFVDTLDNEKSKEVPNDDDAA